MKILIIGPVASGKTTLAKRLTKENNLSYYSIDSIVYDKNNTKRSNQEQQKIIKDINKEKDWLLEGTLRHNLTNLLSLADKIIYLDLPLNIRKRRIIKRYIKQKLKLEKADYVVNKKILQEMFTWTKEFEANKEGFAKMLNKYQNKLIILKSPKEIKEYML